MLRNCLSHWDLRAEFLAMKHFSKPCLNLLWIQELCCLQMCIITMRKRGRGGWRGNMNQWRWEKKWRSKCKMDQRVVWKGKRIKNMRKMSREKIRIETFTMQAHESPPTVLILNETVCHLCSVWKSALMAERWNESDSILLSISSHRCRERWRKRRRLRLSSPLSQDDWWQPTSTQKYYRFAPKMGVMMPCIVMLWWLFWW